MSTLLPISLSFRKTFKPLSKTPATSFVETLPHGRHANILALGDGDPRKILYTLYSEEDNGKTDKVNYADVQDSRGRMM
jgi:hypothetical protein